MAEYKEIRGTTVQNFTTDPSTSLEGQIWYDETNLVLQYNVKNVSSAWVTGNNMNTARRQAAGAGTQTSALVFAGLVTAKQDICESYDGTSWTEVADLNTERNLLAGCGASNTAGLAFGGLSPASPATVGITESFNGTSWTEVAVYYTHLPLTTI